MEIKTLEKTFFSKIEIFEKSWKWKNFLKKLEKFKKWKIEKKDTWVH